MGISRRGFLGAAAGGVTSCLPQFVGRAPWGSAELGGARWPPRPAEHSSRYVLLDLKTPLTESIAGYQRALAQLGVDFVTLPPQPLAQQSACPVAIVPGCVMMDLGAASWLTALLDKGGLVVIESGAAFAEAAEFLAHQQLLASRFGLRVGSPVNLWPEADPERNAARCGRVPYVDYIWPASTKLRDYSRVVPLAEKSTGTIGWAGRLPIAVRRNVRQGTLMFLGSPLGPALLSGDREAHAWLRKALLAG
jgi:hypothetical protein